MVDNDFIRQLWDEVTEDYPDKSTEWVMQMVCDKYHNRTGQEIDHGDVAAALVPMGECR